MQNIEAATAGKSPWHNFAPTLRFCVLHFPQRQAPQMFIQP
jgi:hypothetical protein